LIPLSFSRSDLSGEAIFPEHGKIIPTGIQGITRIEGMSRLMGLLPTTFPAFLRSALGQFFGACVNGFASVRIILFALVKLHNNILRPAAPPALVGSRLALVKHRPTAPHFGQNLVCSFADDSIDT
jgi:hypothetical protein